MSNSIQEPDEWFQDPGVLQCILHSSTARPPQYATSESACFDLVADFRENQEVTLFKPKLPMELTEGRGESTYKEYKASPSPYSDPDVFRRRNGISIPAGHRALIPTNIEFIIEPGYKMLIYPRSGISLKSAINVGNRVGVVDSDFHLPVFVIVQNENFTTFNAEFIYHGMKIAQAEVVPCRFFNVIEAVDSREAREIERNGGFGSTGESIYE